MSFDRNIFSTLGSGIDTMQSVRFYDCHTLQQLEIKNTTLEQPILAENDIKDVIIETESHPKNKNGSIQMYHVFNITSETQQVQIHITPLQPNTQYQVFVSYEEKPTDTQHDWEGLLSMPQYSAHDPGREDSTILPKETFKRLGTYYALVRVHSEFEFYDNGIDKYGDK